MQVFIYTNKTYTLEIDSDWSVKDFKEKIFEKTKIPIKLQSIIHNGKIINGNIKSLEQLNIKPNDSFRINTKILGGNFFSLGEYLFYLIISFIGYYLNYFINLLGFKYFLIENADYQELPNIPNNSDTSTKIIYRILNSLSNNNLQNEKFSILMILYLFFSFLFTNFYSSTITQIIDSHFRCINQKPNNKTIVYLIGIGLLYVLSFPLLLFLSRYNFVQKYSVSLFNIITLCLLVSYFSYTQSKYTFHNLHYLGLTILIMVLLHFNRSTNIWPFLLVPILAGIYFVYIFTIDYQTFFSEMC